MNNNRQGQNRNNNSPQLNPNQEYPGQPYYDENGVLHYPQSPSQRSCDPYEEEYRRQLEEYNRLSGGSDNSNVDLQFHRMDEAYGQENYGGYGHNSGSDRTQSKKQAQPKQANSRSSRSQKAPLQFGENNSYRSPKVTQKKSSDKKKGKESKVKNERKSHPIKTFFLTILIILLVLLILFNVLIWHYISMVNINESGERTYTSASMDSRNVTNILVIGSDTRDEEVNGRTDSMILLSINRSTKQITMTSLMRDMYVNIKGKNSSGENVDFWDKMNAAYVYGGAELLMDTIEYNFDISVDDYVYIDFFSFVDIVDAIGGIEITISDDEAQGMKEPMAEQNDILGNKRGTDYLENGGTILMNGNQALAYARLRYVGKADFERTERQRTVISKIIEKVKSSDPLTMDKFAKVLLSQMSTNMSRTDLYFMTYKALFSAGYEINSLRIPADDAYSYGNHNGQSTLDVDLDKCRQLLRETIYGEN